MRRRRLEQAFLWLATCAAERGTNPRQVSTDQLIGGRLLVGTAVAVVRVDAVALVTVLGCGKRMSSRRGYSTAWNNKHWESPRFFAVLKLAQPPPTPELLKIDCTKQQKTMFFSLIFLQGSGS